MAHTCDVFVSYKHARHSQLAKQLVSSLKARNLRVRFDVDQLDLKEQGQVDRDTLTRVLVEAVRLARVSVVFSAALEAVALPPGVTREQALASGDCMVDESTGALIAWNWQKLEIDASQWFVSLYPETLTVHSSTTSFVQFPTEREMLETAEGMVLDYLGMQG